MVKIFGFDRWRPAEDSFRLVEEKLGYLGVRYPKLFRFDSSDRYFPNGFMISEWIEGTPGEDAIRLGLVTEDKVIEELAKTIRKIHTVTFQKFGYPPYHEHNAGVRSFSSNVLEFVEAQYQDTRYEKCVEECVEESPVAKKLIESGKDLLRDLLDKSHVNVEPVMVHPDANIYNVIWTQDGPVLVDWDWVRADSWAYELATISYHRGESGLAAYCKGYGISLHASSAEIRLLERIYHLAFVLVLLPFFALDVRDRRQLKSEISRLQALVRLQGAGEGA